jgi:two-component system, LytTR family, sensor kinase
MRTRGLLENDFFTGNNVKTLTKVFIHLFIWLVLFSLPLLFRPGNTGQDGPRGGFPIPFPILMNDIFLVIAFYSNLFFLMPRFFNKKQWGFYVFYTLLFLLGSLLFYQLSRWIDFSLFKHDFKQFDPGNPGMRGPSPFSPGMHVPHRGFEFRQFSFVYMFAMTWAISATYYLFVLLQKSVRQADKVLAAALQSELSFLKAQINPHFLFNTLNNIYVLTLKKSELAPTAVMKLSNLMRKITNDTGVDFVPFEEEEQFIRDYLELQQLRLTDKTKVVYSLEGDYSGISITPRLLLPFIENAFKYGVSNRESSEIRISIHFEGHRLLFSIQNAKHPVNEVVQESAGVGLDNSKRLLDLLYKDRHVLRINQTEEDYHVLLEIELI